MDKSAETETLRRQIANLERQIASVQWSPTAAERDQIAQAYSRADSVAKMYGRTASAPIPGERALSYRRRLVAPFQEHSDRFRNTRLEALDISAFAPIEEMIYKDAEVAVRHSASHTPGSLTAVTTREGGRDIVKFYGDPSAWMGAFQTGCQTGTFVRPNTGRN